MKTLRLLILSMLCVGAARAVDIDPGTASPPAPIVLKNKSGFAAQENARNPFWPIGWKPVARTATSTTEHSGPAIPEGAFLVSSITLDHGARFAIVNGKPMQEGQVFGLQMGNQTYQITLKAIEDGRVILLRRDQEIIVPLRRK